MQKENDVNLNLFMSKRLFCYAFLNILMFTTHCSKQDKFDLKTKFSGKYGQVEVGGKYAGLEFHHSRPLPSRLSFYYPVANSVDLSEDYWLRDKSMPFTVILNSDNVSDTLGLEPFPYEYTPFHLSFEEFMNHYHIQFEYDFCDDLPVVVMKIKISNISENTRIFTISTILNTTLRTSHTYSRITADKIYYRNNNKVGIATYPYIETDSTCLFISNVGINPQSKKTKIMDVEKDPFFEFDYDLKLESGEKKEIILLIGTCHIKEHETMIIKTHQLWSQNVQKNQNRIIDYAYNRTYFSVNDTDLQKTMHWSKALVATNLHYINGEYLSMPCPAEYNFFFTHDLLLTNLGVVYFDTDYVKHGLLYLKSLSNKNNVLPHAYYWKDNGFVTEYCGSSNWNHLWFIIIASAYLKHSNDLETIKYIFPMLKQSLELMLSNKNSNDLMFAKHPDWWDIGDVYGARSYITILMYKAIQDYVFLAVKLKKDLPLLPQYIKTAEIMKKNLVEKLWDEEAGYFFNMIDDKTFDRHYYSGSIVATHYDLISKNQIQHLLSTAKNKLLDENIGIRNVIPADFHQLKDVYKIKRMEAGLQYFYFNGGVWPHNNAWYVLGLIQNDQPEDAKSFLKRYMTLNGIKDSPNGIPAFYEYRIADKGSSRYGEIDKPSFLWAGGFYLRTLYQLAGLRENSYYIYFSPKIPQGFSEVEYDLALFGRLCRVTWSGTGDYFRKITIDGSEVNSAVQYKASTKIKLERGKPNQPYLAFSNGQISNVKYDQLKKIFKIGIKGFSGQNIILKIVSPFKILKSDIGNKANQIDILPIETNEIYLYHISVVLKNQTCELINYFE
jgi:glycogen debranching enzyme